MRRTLFLATLMATCSAWPQISQFERRGLADTLYTGNLVETDLCWVRPLPYGWSPLPFSNLCLEKPLEAADALMQLHARAEGAPADALKAACETAFADRFVKGSTGDGSLTFPASVPESLRRPITTLVQAIVESNAAIRSATERLTPEERRQVIESLPQWAVAGYPSSFDFVKQPRLPLAQLQPLVQKVNLTVIRQAAWRLSSTIQAELPKWRTYAKDTPLSGIQKFKVGGILVELSGQTNDVHESRDAALCIDLGGNNIYTGRYGAGVDYTSVLLDFGAYSRFGGPDVNTGAGLLGIGLAYILGGSANFIGKNICYGSGLAGVGMLYKEGGNDTYRCKSLGEGFGMFGVGMLVDTGGSDSYSLAGFGQGAARTGGVGWLIDQAGNDTYRAGGYATAGPLGSEKTRAFAQGYGAGYSPEEGGLAGGIGLLTDANGDDIYDADLCAQAASAWGGVGSLYDGAGTDSYSATGEAQAFASHSAAAYLFDLAGDDLYSIRQGSCHAFGHDWGVAFLLDREGDDLYAARDSRPGTGAANGIGIFLDSAGANRFVGTPASGSVSRGTGSLGIFCQLGGPNQFAEGLEDGQARVDDEWAVALALGKVNTEPETPLVTPDGPKPGSMPMLAEREMTSLLSQANGGNREALNHLVGIGQPAFDWLMKRLSSADAPTLQIMTRIGTALGEGGTVSVAQACASNDLATAQRALVLATRLKAKVAPTAVLASLKRAGTERYAADLAGALGMKEATNDLLPLTASEDLALARAAMLALVQVGDESATPTAQFLLGSADLHIRKAAIKIVGRSANAVSVATQILGASSEERTQRTAIEILSVAGTPEALKAVLPYLSGGTNGTKIQALLALNGRVPAEARNRVLALRKDSNPLVRAVANRIDLGR